MGTTIASDANEPLSFEKVWAMFQESGKRMEEENRRAREQKRLDDLEWEKTKRELSESLKETQRVVAELSKNVGGLNRSMGELIETLIAARLWEKFSGYPYNLQRAYQRIPIYDEKNYARTDIDILLVDTEWAMAVEVKRELREDDIDYHTKRMELIVRYPPAEIKGKKLLGAIAAGVVPPAVRDLAHSKGYFVLELTGESVALAPPPEGFSPMEAIIKSN